MHLDSISCLEETDESNYCDKKNACSFHDLNINQEELSLLSCVYYLGRGLIIDYKNKGILLLKYQRLLLFIVITVHSFQLISIIPITSHNNNIFNNMEQDLVD